MSDRDWRELDERLDQAIDALNEERAPELYEDDDPELLSLVDTLRVVRRLREPAEPDDDYPADLAAGLSEALARSIPAEPVILDNGHVTMMRQPVEIRRRRVRMLVWQIAAVLRVLGVGVIAGMIAGVVVGGVGGRIVMRISGMLYERENPGAVAITESSGRVVGSFSIDGTLGLLMEGMFYGVAGGLFYMILQPWLPRGSRRRGLVYGLLILAVFGTAVAIRGDNQDFRRLGSPLLNIAMFASLFVLYGLFIAPLAERLDRFFPRPGPRGSSAKSRKVAYTAVILAGVLILPMVVLGFGAGVVTSIVSFANFGRSIASDRGIDTLADLEVGLTILGLGVVVPILRLLRIRAEIPFADPAAGRFGRVVALACSRQADVVVYLVLGLAVLLGGAFLLREILDILAITN